jgi:SAM-dependent methyltransferase
LAATRKGKGRRATGRPFVRPTWDAGWEPLDAALAAYRAGAADASLVVRTDVGGDEAMPVAHFHRRPDAMGEVERAALAAARGSVLDLGAGAGALAFPLTERGLTVTALEILPEARAILESGGLTDVRAGGLEALAPDDRFDTVVAVMNGVGLCGTVSALPMFLAGLGAAMAPGGQILTDSTDPRDWVHEDDGRYPGEVHMQLSFGGRAGPPFPFLFVDDALLAQAARLAGLGCEVVAREPDGRYLARLTRG